MNFREFVNTIGSFTPGTVVRFKDGRELLVGDISPRGGQCDCCQVVGDVDEQETM